LIYLRYLVDLGFVKWILLYFVYFYNVHNILYILPIFPSCFLMHLTSFHAENRTLLLDI